MTKRPCVIVVVDAIPTVGCQLLSDCLLSYLLSSPTVMTDAQQVLACFTLLPRVVAGVDAPSPSQLWDVSYCPDCLVSSHVVTGCPYQVLCSYAAC